MGWLVKEPRAALSFEIFERLLRRGLPGLCITRQHPNRVRHERGLYEVRFIWLSTTLGEDYIQPHNLSGLANLIAGFLNDAGKGVILLDGVEYLMIHNGFVGIVDFLEYVNELITTRQAIFLLPVSPQALEEKELAILERNMMVLEG